MKSKKEIFIYIPLLLLLISSYFITVNYDKLKREPQSATSKARLVGYYADWSPVESSYIKDRKFTHIIYSFFIPKIDQLTSEIELSLPPRLVKDGEHIFSKVSLFSNPKLMMAVGGYTDHDNLVSTAFEKIVDLPDGTPRLVSKILDICDEYNLDGVDLDWEFPSEKYKNKFFNLVKSLRLKMNDSRKCHTLSIAVPTRVEDVSGIGSAWYEYVDFVNIMAYDNNTEVHHSSFEHARFALNLWTNTLKLPKDKAVLGIPLYSKPTVFKYSKIIEFDSKNTSRDKATHHGKNFYYNGEHTIMKKTLLGKKFGGIMVWEIGQDSVEKPLIKSIEDFLW